MFRFLYAFVVTIALSHSVSAQYTVHVLNPWSADTCAWHRDSLGMFGNNVVGYYPGTGMTAEGGNWFFYTYQTNAVSFQIFDRCGPSDWQGRVVYSYSINLDSTLMKFPSGTNEIWIVVADTSQKPFITNQPPAGNKVVYFLSPWDIGAPSIQFKGRSPVKMKMDTSIALCGWFKYYYYGKTDSAQAKFINSLDSAAYSSAGIGPGNFIDLSGVLASSDTAWVLPVPPPNGAPSISKQYPNYSAPCQRTLLLGATLRDINGIQPGGHGDFNTAGSRPGCIGPNHDFTLPTLGMVMPNLGPDGKPVLSPNSPCPVDSFNWFKTDTLDKIYTNAKCYNLLLTKNADGLYQFDTAFFFPLDSFKFLDATGTIPNPDYTPGTDVNGFQHNYSFTMQLSAQFEYKKGQTFDFRGDDDVWVFINKRLAVDIGGVHSAVEGSVKLDSIAPLWNLVLGQTYEFDLFFCERWCCGSSFRMVTSLNLRTSSNLFTTTQTLPGGSGKQYNMYQKITQSNLSCDNSQSIVDTQPAAVDFYLTGPQNVPFVQPLLLPTGVSYGGITIPSGNTIVQIDTTKMTGLPPGAYMVHYYLRSDNSQSGAVSFIITSLPPDHYDILADTMTLNLKKDAPVDSIVIGMFDSTATAYAVERDINGLFLMYAANPTWTSRNTQAATVKQLSADSCVITKTGAGVTWVVVSDPAGVLKPDSVKILTLILPKYPVIVSATMLDTNADIVPDMLSITLNDTFKTNQRLDSIIISYRGATYSLPAANAQVNGTSIKAPFLPTTGTDGRPAGQATIAMTTDIGPQTSSKAFIDGVDPAIIAADVLENDNSGPDTLFVTFSEPIQQSSLAGNQLLLIKAGAGDTFSMNILQVLAKTNDSTFTVQVTSSGSQQPKAGDRLRLLPGSRGGTLWDLSKNTPHDLNRSVVLGLRVGPTAIIGSYYLDGNADGFIDTVVMAFKRPVQASSIQTIIVKWTLPPLNIHIDTVPLFTLKKITDSSYCVPVHGESLTPKKVRTNVGMELLVNYTNFLDLPPRSAIVADSAAPVLDSASLAYGDSVAADSSRIDILTTTFSENIQQIGSAHPFLLRSVKNGVQYQFRLTLQGTSNETCRFRVDSIEAGAVPYASKGDSMWIDVNALVSDNTNTQLNPLNRRVALNVVMQKAALPDWVIKVVPNPFIAAQGFTAIISDSSMTRIMDPGEYTVTIDIFDVIGNMVVAKAMPYNGKVWACSWDGRNRNQRSVGSGVYSGLVKVFYGGQQVSAKRIKIGVKR